MRNPSAIMLIIAVLVGAATVWMIRGFLESRSDAGIAANEGQALETVRVVVASRPLNFGDTLHKDLLREVDWPKDAAPEGVFASIDEILSEDERRVALRNMELNELVLRSRVSGFGGRATLSQVITPGHRATAIRVNDVVGVAGFVLPGDRVDILLTRQVGKDRSNLITDVLIQNVRVLAVDQLANDRAESPVVAKATTVEVTPRQAQKLSLAARVGSLTLSLRNLVNGDGDPVKMRTIRVSDLGPGISQPKKKKKAVKRVRRPSTSANIKIVRGLDARTQSVKKEKVALPKSLANPVGAGSGSKSSAPMKTGKSTEPVAARETSSDQDRFASQVPSTVTTADLDRAFTSADERHATEEPLQIFQSDNAGE